MLKYIVYPFVIKYRRALTEVLVASFFVQLFGLANPLVIQVLIDKVLVQGGLATLNVIGLFLLIIALFEGILSALRTYLFADTTNRIDFALGTEIIDRLFRLPLRYFEKRPVGEVASRVNELENIRQFLTSTALTVVLDASFSVIYILIMFIYNWMLALVALAVIPLFALLTFLVTPILRSQLRTKAERHAASQSYLVETLTGIQTVKGQSIELPSRWKWQNLYSRYVAAGFQTVVTSATAGSISHFLEQLSGLVVLWVGARMVLSSQGQFTLGQLIAFRIIAGYVISPLLRLIQLWQNFQETAISLERLSDIVDTPTEWEISPSRLGLPPIRGELRFEELSFRFATTGPLQLVNVNLHIPAGSFVGIVGQSGSGKSTLLKLVSRLYEPLTGRILIDGYDIAKVDLHSLRSQIGLVPQEPLLFEGTVRDNIALTRPESSEAEIIEAAHLAMAHDFIMNLPQGYDTPVGERGAGLSGGQRQRIAIARALLQKPALLLLDEATSALDYDTERKVCHNLIQYSRGRTVLFISHRLKVLQGADKIVVMHQGMVEEEGTHAELMAHRGRYYCLYQQQDAEVLDG
ncbi:MAG TPA: peptidase domain-containing ABC transporter [Thermosynechococcus sp. M46_R2017_013]|nr:peptidase domain-containing ABC transporter [Thermosynechococcus sp. M46_R2017_013]